MFLCQELPCKQIVKKVVRGNCISKTCMQTAAHAGLYGCEVENIRQICGFRYFAASLSTFYGCRVDSTSYDRSKLHVSTNETFPCLHFSALVVFESTPCKNTERNLHVLQVRKSLASHLRLRHPSIISFIGDSHEPGRQEILCITAYIDYGILSAWIANNTLELEPEMVLSVVKVGCLFPLV